MTVVFADMTKTLDGFIAGPNDSPEAPLGVGGGRIHKWAYELGHGANIVGRRMFNPDKGQISEGASRGQWGDDPPFHNPVFIVTHHEHEPVEMEGGTTFTFVTDGIEGAVAQAKAATGRKDVQVSGGANIIQQYINAGLLDEIQVHISPIFLGAGTRLFDGISGDQVKLEPVRVVEFPNATHIRYRFNRT